MRILVIDDSKPMRRLVLRTLRDSGYGDNDFQEASNGLEALEIIESFHPELILADWNMPQMDGLELLKELNRIESEIPFGFVTSEQSDEMRGLASENGALFLIGKPFSVELFQEALSDIIK